MPRSEDASDRNEIVRGVTFSVCRAGFCIDASAANDRARWTAVDRDPTAVRHSPMIGCGPPSGSETTRADDLVAGSGREDLPDVKPRFRS